MALRGESADRFQSSLQLFYYELGAYEVSSNLPCRVIIHASMYLVSSRLIHYSRLQNCPHRRLVFPVVSTIDVAPRRISSTDDFEAPISALASRLLGEQVSNINEAMQQVEYIDVVLGVCQGGHRDKQFWGKRTSPRKLFSTPFLLPSLTLVIWESGSVARHAERQSIRSLGHQKAENLWDRNQSCVQCVQCSMNLHFGPMVIMRILDLK